MYYRGVVVDIYKREVQNKEKIITKAEAHLNRVLPAAKARAERRLKKGLNYELTFRVPFWFDGTAKVFDVGEKWFAHEALQRLQQSTNHSYPELAAGTFLPSYFFRGGVVIYTKSQ